MQVLQIDEMNDPIPYQVRVSPRARNIYLHMSLERGLEVVVPKNFPLHKILELIALRRDWIKRHHRRFEKYRNQQSQSPQPPQVLPDSIHFPAINQRWNVTYRQENLGRVILRRTGSGTIELHGDIENKEACCVALRKWVLKEAKQAFDPWLRKISEETGLSYRSMQIRLQRSRWGSCSPRKTISLNAKLLFLAPELVRYLFIHELCHLVQMNHSPRYWALVAVKEPNYKQLDQALRNAMNEVPWWCR